MRPPTYYVTFHILQCLQNPWKWPEDWKDQAPSQGLWNLPGNNHICYQFTLVAYKHHKCSAWITFVHREFVHRNLVLTFAKFEKKNNIFTTKNFSPNCIKWNKKRAENGFIENLQSNFSSPHLEKLKGIKLGIFC